MFWNTNSLGEEEEGDEGVRPRKELEVPKASVWKLR